jgi:thiamine phosphate phosphatase / amino-HMP aminohydrolase
MALFVDFDGTITSKDTIAVLAASAIRHTGTERAAELRQAWAHIVESYSVDRKEYVDAYQPPALLRDTLTEELSFLEGLKSVEERSLRRVEESQLFSGRDEAFFKAAGKEAVNRGDVVIRPGFKQLVAYASTKSWRVVLVSVNWSRAFIKGVLEASIGDLVHNLAVISNDIANNGKILGPMLPDSARREQVLTTSSDKQRIIQQVASTIKFDRADAQSLAKVIYFGDSLTDLESLIKSPTSIVIADRKDAQVLQTLQRLGYTALHISGVPYPLPPRCLAFARDFEQVLASSFFIDAIASIKPNV